MMGRRSSGRMRAAPGNIGPAARRARRLWLNGAGWSKMTVWPADWEFERMSGRVLVVEDDADTAEYVTKGLREAGFTVEHGSLTGAMDCILPRLRLSRRSSWIE